MAEIRTENELQVSVDICISAGEESDSLLTLCVSITDSMVALDGQCERLERRFARQDGSLKNAVSRLRGRARMDKLNESSLFEVRKGETISAIKVATQLNRSEQEVEEWMARCRNAESEVLQLAQLLRRETSSPASQHQSRSSVGKGQGITRDELVNVGQLYSEVSARQKRRKFSQVKMAVEKALWFMGSLRPCARHCTFWTGLAYRTNFITTYRMNFSLVLLCFFLGHYCYTYSKRILNGLP